MISLDDPVDFCIRPTLDDVDLRAMEMRLDLLLETGADATHAGTEGVSNGFNIASPESGFRAMVFVHSDSVSLWANHSGPVRSNASFQMPADDRLKEALERGGEGVVMFVERWRRFMACTSSNHVTGMAEDPPVAAATRRTSEILSAVISSANPDYPTWNRISVAHDTSFETGSVTVGGKGILTSQAERAVLRMLPRIVEATALTRDKGYAIHSHVAEHEFSPLDPVAVLRAIGDLGIALPDRVLRKAGMEKRA